MSTDLVVIGGGVIGLAAAWRMACEGWSVRLLERDRAGAGASWVAGGMLGAQAEAEEDGAFFRLCLASRETYPDFVAALRQDSGLDPQLRLDGTLLIALDGQEAARLARATGWQAGVRVDLETWTPERIRQQEPALAGALAGGVLFPGEGQVNSPQLISALRQAALQQGVQLHEGEPALAVEHDGRRVLSVCTVRGRYPAGKVLLAAGAWSDRLGGLGFDWMPALTPVRGQVLTLYPRRPLLRRVVRGAGVYLIPRLDGRLVVGATVEEGDFRRQPTAAGVASLLQGALRLAPALADAVLVDIQVGFRPATAHRLPVLGPTPLQGLHLAVGHYRNGILLAPITAELLCQDWLQDRIPALMRPFTVDGPPASPGGQDDRQG